MMPGIKKKTIKSNSKKNNGSNNYYLFYDVRLKVIIEINGEKTVLKNSNEAGQIKISSFGIFIKMIVIIDCAG